MDLQSYPVDPYSSICRYFQHANLDPIVGVGKREACQMVHGDLPRQHPFGTTLRFTGPVPAVNAIGLQICCCCCCCFSYSAHWLPTRKRLLCTVANPARGLLHRKKKKKSLAAPPPLPPPPRCSFGDKIKKSRDASTCLGATQVGVTQVVSVRLASVQGFLRLVG